MSKKEFVYVAHGSVGVQLHGIQVLEELLPPGKYPAEGGVQVFPVEPKKEVFLSFSEGAQADERFCLRYELNQYRLFALFMQPEWQPIRPKKIEQFLTSRAVSILKELLKERSRTLQGVADPTPSQCHEAFGRMHTSKRQELRQDVAEQLQQDVDKICQKLMCQVTLWINGPFAR